MPPSIAGHLDAARDLRIPITQGVAPPSSAWSSRAACGGAWVPSISPKMTACTRHVASSALALGVALLLCACASDVGSRNALPQVSAADADSSLGFEVPPTLRASELLPPEILAGPHHRVAEEVRSDGFVHLYTLSSDYGEFQVAGDDLLRERVKEIWALAVLDEMSASREFASAAARGLQSPFVATWNLIRHPVDTVSGIPSGAWEAIRRTSDLARSERGPLEESAFREFIGFESRKRELAYQLGVDPYSSNKALQTRLNRFAWVSYAGGFPFMLVPFQGGDSDAEESPPAEPPATRLGELLRDYSPEDLRRLNRIELAVIGVPEPLALEFLEHPWFSPRHETVFVESLTAVEAGSSSACVEVALSAGSEFDALFYQRAVELLRAYHERRAPITRCVAIGSAQPGRFVLGGVSEDGTLVIPELVDHLVWTRPAAALADELALGMPSDPEVRRRELLLSGTLSGRARAELEARGIGVTANAFHSLSDGPETPHAALDP